jgi:ParB family chromosome partitioning protein
MDSSRPDTTSQSNSKNDAAQPSSLSYKGPVSGLKGLLTTKIAEGLASVVSTFDKAPAKEAPKKMEGGTEKIAIDRIYPCSDQPRQVFDPKTLEELSNTMREIGQAQAITVRKTNEGFEIISGERRYRAAKLAGLTHLDCVVKECGAKEARLLALVENIQRQDLLPLEESHFLKKVLEENPDMSLEKLAKVLGSHKSTLSEKIQLTEIPEDLQGLLLTRGRYFTHRHWRVVSRIEDHAFLRTMIEQAVENQLSVAELERSLQAAGIRKAPRRNPREAEKLGFAAPALLKRSGSMLKFRAFTADLTKLSREGRDSLRQELEEALKALQEAEMQTSVFDLTPQA